MLTRGFKYSDLTWKILVFWKTGEERWLLTRSGCNQRFNCINNVGSLKQCLPCDPTSLSISENKSGLQNACPQKTLISNL